MEVTLPVPSSLRSAVYHEACAVTVLRSTAAGSRPGTRKLKLVLAAVVPWRAGSPSSAVQMVWSLNAGPNRITVRALPAPPARLSTWARICEIAAGSEGWAECALESVVPPVQLGLVGTCEASGTTPSPREKNPDSEFRAEARRPAS